MPIYVQWKWKENTQTFVLILHFDADSTEMNLRTKDMTFGKFGMADDRLFYFPSQPATKGCQLKQEKDKLLSPKRRIVTTWAPSHIEIGYMSELLSYANLLNGLKIHERQELRPKLDITSKAISKYIHWSTEQKDEECLMKITQNWVELGKATDYKACLVGCDYNFKEKQCESVFCTLLTLEYVEYFKKLLRPYLKNSK